MVAPDAPLLSPRGKVLENGMPRFFRRLAEGVFDEEDVRRRAQEIADFVEEARGQYGISSPIALGYSNGANIAAAILLVRPEALGGAILLRAMVPLSQSPPLETERFGFPVGHGQIGDELRGRREEVTMPRATTVKYKRLATRVKRPKKRRSPVLEDMGAGLARFLRFQPRSRRDVGVVYGFVVDETTLLAAVAR